MIDYTECIKNVCAVYKNNFHHCILVVTHFKDY